MHITEMLPKSPNSIFVLSGYFNPDNYTPVTSHMHRVRIFVSGRLQAHKVFFNSRDFEDQIFYRLGSNPVNLTHS